MKKIFAIVMVAFVMLTLLSVAAYASTPESSSVGGNNCRCGKCCANKNECTAVDSSTAAPDSETAPLETAAPESTKLEMPETMPANAGAREEANCDGCERFNEDEDEEVMSVALLVGGLFLVVIFGIFSALVIFKDRVSGEDKTDK